MEKKYNEEMSKEVFTSTQKIHQISIKPIQLP